MSRLAASARGAAEGVAAGQRGGPRGGVVPGPRKRAVSKPLRRVRSLAVGPRSRAFDGPPRMLIWEIREEARDRQSLDKHVAQDIWKLGRVAEGVIDP